MIPVILVVAAMLTDLQAAGAEGVGENPKPSFHATVGRTDTRVRFLSEGRPHIRRPTNSRYKSIPDDFHQHPF